MIEEGCRRKGRGSHALTLLLAVTLAAALTAANAGTAFADFAGPMEAAASDSNAVIAATASDAAPEYGPGMERLASDSNAVLYSCETSGVFVSVFFQDKTGLPEGLSLSVTPIDPDSAPEQYEQLCGEFEESWSGDARTMQAYDIGLFAEDGSRVELEQTAVVSFEFGEEPLQAEGGLSVVHFKADGPELLDILEAETCSDTEVSKLTFRTDGFSAFAFVRSGIMPITGGNGTGLCTMAGALLLLGAWLLYKYQEGSGKGGEKPAGV